MALSTITATATSSRAADPPRKTSLEPTELQLELLPPLPLQIGRLAPAPTAASEPRTNPHLSRRPTPATPVLRTNRLVAAPGSPAENESPAAMVTQVAETESLRPAELLRPAATVLTLRPISTPETDSHDEPASQLAGLSGEATEATFVTPAVPPTIPGEGGSSVVHAAPPADAIRFSISDDGVSAKATLQSEPALPALDSGSGVARLAPPPTSPRPRIVAAPLDPVTLAPAPESLAPRLKPMTATPSTAKATAAAKSDVTSRATTPTTRGAEEAPAAIVRRPSAAVIPVPRAEVPRPVEPQPAAKPVPKPAPKSAADVPAVASRPASPPTSKRSPDRIERGGSKLATSAASDRRPVVIASAAPPSDSQPAQPAPQLLTANRALVIEVPAKTKTSTKTTISNDTTISNVSSARSQAAPPAPADRPEPTSDFALPATALIDAPTAVPTPAPSAATAAKPAAASSTFSETPAGDYETIQLRTAETQPLTPRTPIRRVELENREICEAVLVGPHKLLLIGRQDGATRLALWSGDTATPTLYEVRVGSDHPMPTGGSLAAIAQRLTETIAATYPQCHVRVVTEGDGLAVHGRANSQDAARAIMRLVRRACLTSVDDNLEIR
ncbi:pilus assembly protein N-terminal domain-containing protein [Candidatus Laterigemmans baculatus]|uniref:pilus assembly protein N-terminal domain-containing protein n=1 Tax=Candidatus Laterigemmans baculatus TaxID=2770505 RepID=UPI0013DC54C3|nr:pilus assembly protein N-terminal domain-containing protein [Candidatus Laterigemmans baculatus]